MYESASKQDVINVVRDEKMFETSIRRPPEKYFIPRWVTMSNYSRLNGTKWSAHDTVWPAVHNSAGCDATSPGRRRPVERRASPCARWAAPRQPPPPVTFLIFPRKRRAALDCSASCDSWVVDSQIDHLNSPLRKWTHFCIYLNKICN